MITTVEPAASPGCATGGDWVFWVALCAAAWLADPAPDPPCVAIPGELKRSIWILSAATPASRRLDSTASIIGAGPQMKASSIDCGEIRVCSSSRQRGASSRPESRSISFGSSDSTWISASRSIYRFFSACSASRNMIDSTVRLP